MNASSPVWPSAMIVCCTGPRAAPGASMGTRKAVSARRSAPSTRAITCACSTNGAPVIRCFTPFSTQPVAVAARGGLEREGVRAGPRLGEREGHAGAPGEEVGQVALARLRAPVAHQVARAVGPGEHPLHPAQAVPVHLLLDVEGVHEAEAQAVGRGKVGAVQAGARRRLLHPALEPDHGRGQAAVRLQREGGRPDLLLDLLHHREGLLGDEPAHPLERPAARLGGRIPA